MPRPDHLPPKISLKLIQWLCKSALIEELEGNLCQFYAENRQHRGGKVLYWYQVINYLRPSTLKTFQLKNDGPMFAFNPLLTLRNLSKHPTTTSIHILGFTLGLVATFFLYFYLKEELNTDSFHVNKSEIYRAIRVADLNGTPYSIGVTSGLFAPALENDFPAAISSSTRAFPQDGLVSFDDKNFIEENLLFADANFFQFFSFPLKVGDPSTVLTNSNAAVLSQEMAQKYFGDTNPIGQLIQLDNEDLFEVTGIFDTPPSKSHLTFGIVLSISYFEFTHWWNNGLMTYVQIPTPEMAANVDSQLGGFMDKYFGEDFQRSGTRVDLTLEPLEEIYFNHQTRYDWASHGNERSVYILGLVALAILFIACFNYVNLTIAQSFLRAKEVGVRKVLGVHRKRLILQFLGESVVILLIAILLSVLICELLNPAFNRYFQLDVDLRWMDANVGIFFLGLLLTILIVAGIYPAGLLSSFSPIQAMKGGRIVMGKSGLRKGLVITQFAISIFLIIATLLISIQTNYLNNKDLGFDRDAVILVDMDNRQIRSERRAFKDRLLANSAIRFVSNISGEPGGFHDTSGFMIEGIDENNRMRTLFTDHDYHDLFGIELLAGRTFDKVIDADTARVLIINQRAVEEIGVPAEELIGRKAEMPTWGITDLTIIGVVQNFHFSTLKDEIEPLAMLMSPFSRKMAIKVNSEDLRNSLLFIDEVYRELVPDFPMTYTFLDEGLARLYENEQKQAHVFTAFSSISIFLACLGILGLAAYSAQLRQKELGIRKILGATPAQIVRLISRDFLALVITGGIIAFPAAWYFISNWLGDFAYRITLTNYWFIFLIGALAGLLIALITVSFKTYRAAVADPTSSIRNE